MIRRDASASRGGAAQREDESAEDFQVDEWSPMLRCSTAPSLATITTPKAWPESAMYPHGSQPKRMQPSPWYDGETTANTVRASTAGPGMRRVAASHGQVLLLAIELVMGKRDASAENTKVDLLTPQQSRPVTSPVERTCSATGVAEVRRSLDGGRVNSTHVRTPKRMDQETGYLSGGVYFVAPKDPLRHGLHAALAAKLVQQTELDGLKWYLLKQILKVITGSQHGLPLQAVQHVVATFGKVVGTSKLATKAQFVDHITGKHEGFPESELTTLFGFFMSPMPPGLTTTTTGPAKEIARRLPRSQQPGGVESKNRKTRRRRTTHHVGKTDAGRGGGGTGRSPEQGADWTLAVACLRLLARPKESVMEAVLGVFDVFARARGSRARHRRRFEQERVEKERQARLEDERERWKRRRRRQQESGVEPPAQVGKRFEGPEPCAWAAEVTAQGFRANGGDGDVSNQEENVVSSSLNRVSFTETARVFSLVCSNDQERHKLATTYRHRFRLELRAVMQEERRPGHGKHYRHLGDGSGSRALSKAADTNCALLKSGKCSPCHKRDGPLQGAEARHNSETLHLAASPVDGRPSSAATEVAEGESDPIGTTSCLSQGRREATAKCTSEKGDKGVTTEEFREALMRCPEMLEAFGSQLMARFRHRHRPIWMAPFSRKGS
ncbi:unnamed protein product [Scytosiphon promiscuus]